MPSRAAFRFMWTLLLWVTKLTRSCGSVGAKSTSALLGIWPTRQIQLPLMKRRSRARFVGTGWTTLFPKGGHFQSPRFNAVQPVKAAELRSMLEEKATVSFKITGCPCGYLGYLVSGNASTWQANFEADPAKWPVAALQAAGRRTAKIVVSYQWLHVTIGPAKKPHRVSMRPY